MRQKWVGDNGVKQLVDDPGWSPHRGPPCPTCGVREPELQLHATPYFWVALALAGGGYLLGRWAAGGYQ